MIRTTFNMRVSPEERARLDALAEHYGVTGADVVRILLKERYDALAKDGALGSKRKTR